MKTIQKNGGKDRQQMMRDAPITPLLISMSVPTIVGMLITSVYNMADTYFVHYLGTSATAAVGVNYSIEQIIMMAGSFLATGANSYIARLLGAEKREKASSILSTAFFTAMGFGTVVAVLGLVFIEPLVVFLGATETSKAYAVSYGANLLYAAPFMAANFVLNQCLRSEGSATYSMIGMAAGGILNLFLDPLFIFTFDMGIAGAAIATSISKIFSFIILVLPYLRHKSVLNLSIRNVHYVWADCMQVITVGTASLFRSLCSILASIAINNAAGACSDSCLAAISVTTKIMMVPFSIFLGFGQGVQPICGFNWGARQYHRVKECFRTASLISLILPVVLAVGLMTFAEPIICLFAEADPELVSIGKLCLLCQCIALPIHAWGVVVNMVCAGLGKARKAFVMSISRQGIFFFPMVWLLPRLFDAAGVACAQGAADLLTAFMAVPIAIQIHRELDARQAELEAEK